MTSAPRARLAAVQGCACFNLRKAARAVTQLYDEHLRPSGLRSTQFSLLAVLSLRGPLGISQLAEAAVMDRTTLTRNLELLQREGLVKVRAAPGDARVREVSLTPAAQERLAAALPLWERAQAHVTGELGAPRSAQLLSHLSAAIAAAQAATGAGAGADR